MNNILCIYHGGCADGFGAAYALWLKFPNAEFYAGKYGESPPDVTGKDVVIVDFSYKKDVITELSYLARSLLIIDHHKSAYDDLKHIEANDCKRGWEYFQGDYAAICASQNMPCIAAIFDMEKSGAVLAWEFFHQGRRVPAVILHIQDRDLWKFELPETREIMMALYSYPMEFKVWEQITQNRGALAEEGRVINRYYQKNLNDALNNTKQEHMISGYSVSVCNAPYFMASDLANILCEDKPFAACYYDSDGWRNYSLRSKENGVDVSAIAQQYGGGGHKHAAGFRIKQETPAMRG